ncbi:copine-8 [Fundulus heteroclitus]|uniref:copine-8 n=2 Tax=Cyprinodontoidei TaxID=8087 RepID=UPI00165BA513|nr:copine-8 [Fundulus heteroclitus]
MNMARIGDADPFTAAIPATKVELTVSCRNLLDRDTFSKSDPICVLYTQGIANREWREQINFNDSFLFIKGLCGIPGKKCGSIIIRSEELSNCRESVMLQFCGNKLDKKDFFGKSDPFLVFYRSNEDGSHTICHKTEVVKNTLDPVWQAFKIPVRALCNGDYDRSIKVEVYDWDRDGGHDFIGEFSTSYREMCRSQSQFHVYEVLNPKKKGKKKKKYLNSGTVTLLSCLVDTELSFLDYIRGGTQINFTVAIDFTASNGNPSQPTSLHYMSPYQLNDYAMALRAIGEIIQDYDSDKMFPALGFGAKLPPDGRVSHEFPLNGNPQNPYCKGIDGVMEAYYQSLKSVRLYGPTHFSPVINHVARYASAVTDGSQYFILLIISDGVITDMAQTKESIVNAASLPMSIIIVGVGPAEFDEMIELDGDEERISSQGRYAERDIVQFVPFRDYIDRRGNHILSMARLAKEVLAEIPDQFLSYMRTRGIKPGPQPPPYTPCPPPAIHPLHTRRVSRI